MENKNNDWVLPGTYQLPSDRPKFTPQQLADEVEASNKMWKERREGDQKERDRREEKRRNS